MAIIAKETGGSFVDHPTGVFPARCIGLIDMGHQVNDFNGKHEEFRQVVLYFQTTEMPDQCLVGWYRLSLHAKASLRADLEAWRGRAFTAEELEGFDLANVVGKPCSVNVVPKQNGGTKLGSVGKAIKGAEVPEHDAPWIIEPHSDHQPDEVGDKMWERAEAGWDRMADHTTPAPETTAAEDDLNDEIPF